jgi:hypothetical protein
LIQEYFTWEILLTQAGAVAAVLLFTQLFKGVGAIQRIPTRLFSYAVALLVLLAALFFTGQLSPETAALALINSAVISVAANGGFELLKQGVSSSKAKDETT